MPLLEFICLANSRKLGCRCVAGIRADTGEWVRPISDLQHGELSSTHRQLSTHGEPENFDLIRIGVSQHSPTNSQPENWRIDGTSWELVSRPAPSRLQHLLQAQLYRNALLFGCSSDRIAVEKFKSAPAPESLALVKPQDPTWVSTTTMYGKRQARVRFKLNIVSYDLVLTDPPFEGIVKQLDPGDHTSADVGIRNEETLLLTISLGEEFYGNYYKLVAAVLKLPEAWTAIA